jgi:uncharacterized protein
MPATETWTVVPTTAGELRALIQVPDDAAGPLPGVVLVDGSGDGACDDWGEWPQRFLDCGAVVLTHDKPGSGESPGDWTQQSFEDRAHESLAALHVLRGHPAVAGRRVGLLGFSQGGWVAPLAAAVDPAAIDFVVTVSGPGVGPARQERYRIERALRDAGTADEDVEDALRWIDERTRRLCAGEPVGAVLADQERLPRRACYAIATEHFDQRAPLAFLARNLDFDPVPVLRRVQCPVLALFGADDTVVPVAESVAAIAAHLRPRGGCPGIGVFPGGDHGLFTADPEPGVPRTEQLAPGFLPMLAGFLADLGSGALAGA